MGLGEADDGLDVTDGDRHAARGHRLAPEVAVEICNLYVNERVEIASVPFVKALAGKGFEEITIMDFF